MAGGMSGFKRKIRNSRSVRRAYYWLKGVLRKKGRLRLAEKICKRFGVTAEGEQKKALLSDMLRMNRLYGYGFDEYFLYDFSHKNIKERRAFVAEWEHIGYAAALNDDGVRDVFDNKWKTYQTYPSFFKRDVILCTDADGPEAFLAFVKAHPSFIAKPVDSSGGKGVKLFHAGEDAEELYREMLKEYGGEVLIEELIRQDEQLAAFHPQSVNTLRIPTIRFDDETILVHPRFRFGRGGSVVDNVAQGGVICMLDPDTGVVFAAADEAGKHYEAHPDTGAQLVGFQMPRWEEAKAFVKELAEVVPENRYTSWDIALTDDGWVLVEGNRCGQFGWQIVLGEGCRAEFDGYIKRAGAHY